MPNVLVIGCGWAGLRAHEEIDYLIKKGSKLAVCLQADLSEIMWEHCGVVKDEQNLNEGLRKSIRS